MTLSAARHAVVTGGGTGIGRATAQTLVDQGWTVTCVGLDADPDLPPGLRFRRVDVTSAAELESALSDLREIAALVNCAGIIKHAAEWQTEGFEQVLSINLTSILTVSQLLIPRLEAARGSIVNIASMWSYFGSAGAPAYSASKAGVVGLTKSLAVAYAPRGVRANAVAPGWITTQISAGARQDEVRSTQINARIPMARWGDPAEVGQAIAFLVSPAASYITGSVLNVDGGYSSS